VAGVGVPQAAALGVEDGVEAGDGHQRGNEGKRLPLPCLGQVLQDVYLGIRKSPMGRR
jgi:hypothetical protein